MRIIRRRLNDVVQWRIALIPFVLVLALGAAAQDATFFALQRPGQGSIAIDKMKQTAYITDLGKSGDGNKVLLDGEPLLDRLAGLNIRRLVFTCSHPHSDHMGGIRALFENPRPFFADDEMTTRRFEFVYVVDNGVSDSLFSILKGSLPAKSGIQLTHISADNKNAFTQISSADDDIFIESVPYQPAEKAGPHGRSVVTRLVLGKAYSTVDFDDADSPVIKNTVRNLMAKGVTSIDAFVVPHHGSAYHDIEPILELHPKVAILTVNPKNPYGHPSPSILLGLIDRLGAPNVLFTGSADHVVLGPEGVKKAQYTAANRESFELFVRPNYRKAESANNKAAVELFKKLEKQMAPAPEEASAGSGESHTDRERSDRLIASEIEAELSAAEQANRDLFAAANNLALATSGVTAEERTKLQDAFAQQGRVLDRLAAHIQNRTNLDQVQLKQDRRTVERLAAEIRHSARAGALPSGQGDPFSDNELQQMEQGVRSGIDFLEGTASRHTRTIREVSEIRFAAPLETARTGNPVVRVWESADSPQPVRIPEQIQLPYNTLLSPKAAGSRPGGIVLGNSARLRDRIDLREDVLWYDPARQLVLLSGPNGSELSYPRRLDPDTLRVLYSFASSPRVSAISLATTQAKGIERLVRLDSAFVDTPVGSDLIAADLIGWRLRLRELPDGRPNPLAESFASAEEVIYRCVSQSTRATLIDNPTIIGVTGTNIILQGGLRLEYMGDIPGQLACTDAACTNPAAAGNKACHFTGIEQLAKSNYLKIMDLYPPLRRVNEYAQIVAFLRWAGRPGNIAAIDFSGLAIGKSSRTEYRTPDALTAR